MDVANPRIMLSILNHWAGTVMGYDLLRAPDGYRTDLALVIAPYFDPKFARQLIKQMKPRRLRFLVDDGASNDDVHKLRQACGNLNVKIGLGRTVGIVHIKGFYMEFVKSSGRARHKRQFIFGSPNATEAAFGGDINAELVACVDLSAGEDKGLLDYLNAVLKAIEDETGSISGVYGHKLCNTPSLLLPSFRVSAIGPAPGFDAWLQRGRLVAKYREAQQFMTVAVKLRKKLPQGLIANILADQGLIRQGAQDVVRHPYIPTVDVDNDDDENTLHWYARFCVWTHLNAWISEECFKSRQSSMQSNAAPSRLVRLTELLQHGEESRWKEDHREAFVSKIDAVWKNLVAARITPSDYLESKGNGIDAAHYKGRFNAKLKADLLLARDDDFRGRFVNGYDFPRVPKFRQDAAAWEAFVQSWCESIAIEAARRRPQSLVTRVVRSAFEKRGEALAALDANDIRRMLRDFWKEFGVTISAYFEE